MTCHTYSGILLKPYRSFCGTSWTNPVVLYFMIIYQWKFPGNFLRTSGKSEEISRKIPGILHNPIPTDPTPYYPNPTPHDPYTPYPP